MPYFLSKPIAAATTIGAQSVSGIKPILTSVISGGYVTIAFDSTSQYYFASCFTDELLDYKSRLIDSDIVEKHLNGYLYQERWGSSTLFVSTDL